MVTLQWEVKKSSVPDLLRRVAWYRQLVNIVRSQIPEPVLFPITVVMVDDERITELNGSYRNLHKRTDVLSFYYPAEAGVGEGELFISIPTAERQAVRYKISLTQEMARLMIHGVLHLHDYDHVQTRDRVVMRGFERKAMIACKRNGLL